MDIKTKNTYWLNAAAAVLIILALVIGFFGGVGESGSRNAVHGSIGESDCQ